MIHLPDNPIYANDYYSRHGSAVETVLEECPFCSEMVEAGELGGCYGRRRELACDACATVFDAEDAMERAA